MKYSNAQCIEFDRTYAWHPFTQMKEWREGETPLLITKANGNYIFDSNGKKYFDGVSSLWCNIHGHRKPAIDRAIRRQLKRAAHTTFLGLTHPLGAELSKRLVDIAPKGLAKAFYSDSGSEAVEIALKMTYQYWQLKGERKRARFLSFTDAYHGDTIGSVSVGGVETFHARFRPLLFKTDYVPALYNVKESRAMGAHAYAERVLARVEEKLKMHEGEYVAVVVEPLIHAAGGFLVYPEMAYRKLRALTKQYNTLLIADEVATGFGHTGAMFASIKTNVTPDVLCVAKGLTGGYLPLAATLTTDEIYNAYYDEPAAQKTFYHGHTYTANPLACAAALASLRVFEHERVIERLAPKIAHLNARLKEIESLTHVGSVRSTGTMVGIELFEDAETLAPYPLSARMGAKACDEAVKRGVWIRPLDNVVVLMPPLSITEKEIDMVIDRVKEAIIEATERSVLK